MPDKLHDLSSLVRRKLLGGSTRDEEWVLRGTEPKEENFQLINFEDWGVSFTFPEYQIGCYAEGEHQVFVSYEEIRGIADQSILERVRQGVL